jgi:hypothetical protein
MKTIITKIPSRQSYILGKGTVDIGYPWVTLGAIMALEYIVNKSMKVLEFGSGGSTIFWSKNCKSVKSYETNPYWFKKLATKTEGTNVEMVLGDQEKILEDTAKEPDNYYDLVLIDADPHRNRRLLFANASIPKLKLGGWLVIDNYWRYSMNDFDYSKWEVYTFDEFDYQGKGTRICKKVHNI